MAIANAHVLQFRSDSMRTNEMFWCGNLVSSYQSVCLLVILWHVLGKHSEQHGMEMRFLETSVDELFELKYSYWKLILINSEIFLLEILQAFIVCVLDCKMIFIVIFLTTRKNVLRNSTKIVFQITT